jgi:hypothetical protein
MKEKEQTNQKTTNRANTDLETQKIQKRLKLAEDLFNFAYSVKFHQLKKKHTDWSEKQVHEHTMLLIERGCA